MAHFAEIEDGIVKRVVVVSNDITYQAGMETEQRGIDYLESLDGTSATWVHCSYSATFRHNFPGPDDSWDGTGFAKPQPYPSWTLNDFYRWEPPVPAPSETRIVEHEGRAHEVVVPYIWDEDTLAWVELDVPE